MSNVGDKRMSNSSNKMPVNKTVINMETIQEIMHYHGKQKFLSVLYGAAINARDEMANINSDTSDAWDSFAQAISEMQENQDAEV